MNKCSVAYLYLKIIGMVYYPYSNKLTHYLTEAALSAFLVLGVENIVANGEIAQIEQFHHFPQCFLPEKVIELQIHQYQICCLQILSN